MLQVFLLRLRLMDTSSLIQVEREGERSEPDLTIIVVSYNTAPLIEPCFAALERASEGLRLQIIVVDNASRDASVNILRKRRSAIELIENSVNVGFGRANNQALSLASGRYILLLNTDAFVAPDTLSTTIAFMDAHPAFGVLGVRLVSPDGSLQPSCRYFPTPWNVFVAATGIQKWFPRTRLVDDMAWDHDAVRRCDWVPGCYYLIRREVIERIGLFDPRFFLYSEEVDHCRRVKEAGWEVVYYPHTRVVHTGGESATSVGQLDPLSRQLSPLQVESEFLYFRKHHGMTGVIAAVVLGAVTGAFRAGSSLIRRRDPARAAQVFRHLRLMMQVSFATRLGARATR